MDRGELQIAVGAQHPAAMPARVAPAVVEVAGVRFQNMTEEQCVEHVVTEAAAGRGGWVVTPNLEILRQCVRDLGTRALVHAADLVVCDGTPIMLASHLQRTPLVGRVCGSNLIHSLPAAAAERGLSVYLLGGAPGTADETAEVLRQRHPTLRIVGTYCPPFGFESNAGEIAAMAEAIRAARPQIIFVALSFPKGERLIQRIRPAAPQAWWVGVGISFSFACGHVQRAPRWMQRSGLEWVHRLSQEPGRLARRYLVQGLPFAAELAVRSTWRRFRPAGITRSQAAGPRA
ncbi:MAG: WecB/TagA/CpsF family glycosyltransferase [Planctomycetota bacterium]